MSQLPLHSAWLIMSGQICRITIFFFSIFFTFSISAQNVGINTLAPKAGLHVVSNDGILATGEFGQGIVQDSGFGTRLMWIPSKGAFRFGGLNGETADNFYTHRWDPDSIGDYSFAGGLNNRASGNFSFAFGNRNVASGDFSTTLGGFENIASGRYSLVAGLGNRAPSGYETVLGFYAKLYTPNDPNGFDGNDHVFTIGNGTNQNNRNNALTILKLGNVGINTDLPQDKLHVIGNVRIDAGRLPFVNTGQSVFIGDSAGISDDLTGNQSVFIGHRAGRFFQNGINNIAIGAYAFDNATTGNYNIAIGQDVLGDQNMSGNYNTGIGHFSLANNESGHDNLALGQDALGANTSGFSNIALGNYALDENTGGSYNTAIGKAALGTNISGDGNIAIGSDALHVNTVGSDNTAIGNDALRGNTTGGKNVIIGNNTMQSNTIGNFNTIVGQNAYNNNTSGSENSVLGFQAGQLSVGSQNTFIGTNAGRQNIGSGNVFLGFEAGRVATSISNKLFIENTSSNTPLIWGDFQNNKVVINDSLTSKYFQMTNGAGANKLLQSNSSGHGTWIDPNTIFTDDWTANGNNIYNNNSSNVGIGTSTPFEKLQVNGNIRVEAGRITFENTGFGTFIGRDAGLNDVAGSLNGSTFLGEQAGLTNTTGGQNTAVGSGALKLNSTGQKNTAIGSAALFNNQTGEKNIGLGYAAMNERTSGNTNIGIGFYALKKNNGANNISFGEETGADNLTGSNNIFLGSRSGEHNTGSGNLFMGNYSGNNETGSNKLYISNSNTSTPLIYGDFATKKVFVNDSLGSKYLKMTNGAANGYLLKSDANGNGSWVAPSTLFSDDWSTNGSNIFNTSLSNVGIGTNNPQSKLHVAGSLLVDGGHISVINTVNSIFVGEDAGSISTGEKNIAIGSFAMNANTMGSENFGVGYEALHTNTTGSRNLAMGTNTLGTNTIGNENIALGSNALSGNTTGNGNIGMGIYALSSNTTGGTNIAIGSHSLENNQTGANNIAMGFFAGSSVLGGNNTMIGIEAGFSTIGTGNVMLGYQAGKNEAGNNKLYISNSLTSTPLLLGDFATKKLTINDSLSTEQIELNGGRLSFSNTGQSVFIGNKAGLNDDHTTNNNVFIGEQAGKNNATGTNDIAIGAFALDGAVNSFFNIALGQDAIGSSGLTGGYNIGIGNFSLAANTAGGENIALGQNTLGSNTDGTRNVSIGNYSMDANTNGSYNTTLGYEAMGENVTGNFNVAIGHYAGNGATGDNNIFIGASAGISNIGSGNIFLGSDAGLNETGSNKLYMDNSSTSSPLIYGDFTSNEVTINDSLTVNKELGVATSQPNSTFEVNGSVAAKFQTPLVAGTTNPDATGLVWRYTSGSGTITLPTASTCTNRMYVIINQTGTSRNISGYRDLVTNVQTTLGSSQALWVMSDGSQWWQIK